MEGTGSFIEAVGITLPIIQAPMAGPTTPSLAAAVTSAGGLGSLPMTLLDLDAANRQVDEFLRLSTGSLNLNFFCHVEDRFATSHARAWREKLRGYFDELGLPVPEGPPPRSSWRTFDDGWCTFVEERRPAVVSFHFGLPAPALVARVKEAGCFVMSSATTVAEARWLQANGADAVIAQGSEAGGHRGMFLNADLSTQSGLFALLPNIVSAVSVPVIAAGGISDGRGILAARVLGAAAVQIGTRYLSSGQASVSEVYRLALANPARSTVLTNVLSGRPARSIANRAVVDLGPLTEDAPPFPYGVDELATLKATAEKAGSSDFSGLWCGQGRCFSEREDAGDLTQRLYAEYREACSGWTTKGS